MFFVKTTKALLKNMLFDALLRHDGKNVCVANRLYYLCCLYFFVAWLIWGRMLNQLKLVVLHLDCLLPAKDFQ